MSTNDLIDMNYDEFMKTVPGNKKYENVQFTALRLSKGTLGLGKGNPDYKEVGTFKSIENPARDGSVKVCFSRRSVVIQPTLFNSQDKIFRVLNPEGSQISISNPMLNTTTGTTSNIIGSENPRLTRYSPFNLTKGSPILQSRKQGGRKSRRKPTKKRSTRRRRH
jgi:hypothetical protein